MHSLSQSSAAMRKLLNLLLPHDADRCVQQVTVRASGTTNVSSQVEPLLSQVEGAPVPMDVPSNLTLGLQLAQQTVTGVDTPNCKVTRFTTGEVLLMSTDVRYLQTWHPWMHEPTGDAH